MVGFSLRGCWIIEVYLEASLVRVPVPSSSFGGCGGKLEVDHENGRSVVSSAAFIMVHGEVSRRMKK
jgi:hypothetical protein